MSDLYPPVAGGGYERSCADVVEHWCRAGHAVTVLTTRSAVPSTLAVRRELPLVPDGGDHPRAAAVICSVLEQVRPDVVSIWNAARVPQRALFGAVRSHDVPVVIVACDGWLSVAQADVDALPTGSRIAWISHALRRGTALPAWAPVDQDVVGGGIASGVFPARHRRPRGWRGRLLFVGRLTPAKGGQDAVRALALLAPPASLRVVGVGSDEQWARLQRLAEDLGVASRVELGRARRDELPGIYRAADALLFPSRWEEPFGLVPLEAMACGTPVVATGTGGSGEYLVDGTNAVLVPPRCPDALANAVTRLAGDPALRARLIRHGLRTSRRHTIDRVAVRLEAVHRRAASARS